MDGMLPIIGVGVLALACPLCMVVMGGVAWVLSRARGRKNELPETTGTKP